VARRAALWLLFLAPFFYAAYGLANWYASTLPQVDSIVFRWERHIPFIAWSILPYWSINAFYALSLFVNEDTAGVDRLAGRYLSSQLVACLCFVAFPLAASFTRPDSNGLPGFMFDVLAGFDKPFNQAPSLHIALLVVIWDHLRRRLPRRLRPAWHGWCALIGASVLTTYQHHFIDIPTGALLGLFALWLFPADSAPPFAGFRWATDGKRQRLAAGYALGAALLLGAAWSGAALHMAWLALLWPALALAIVAFGYCGAGEKIFQKRADGSVSLASRLLIWPYRLGARLNAWAWTRRLQPHVRIAEEVHLGRFPRGAEGARFATVIDLTAEFERPGGAPGRWLAVPMLDLVPPPAADIACAARLIEEHRTRGPLLVCCALGFQRSAHAVAAWLVATGRAADAAAAEAVLRRSGRPVHIAPRPAAEHAG
jgi:protein-tyrosine phosphatase